MNVLHKVSIIIFKYPLILKWIIKHIYIHVLYLENYDEISDMIKSTIFSQFADIFYIYTYSFISTLNHFVFIYFVEIVLRL